ncbi:S9 family peptidase [Aureispira anguillae]|uniref:S9 family peptidase n=1 Tax=Aureispira anguillae TaxID=2864201 RepID=A0A915YB51_9BACT|nr:S9 family peptidase [Aureispira anguillae]BDS09829.1 S9 family peptidase [Aureispira anguillae]
MKKIYLIFCLSCIWGGLTAQENLSPKQLLELNRVSAVGLTDDKSAVIYRATQYDVAANAKSTTYYLQALEGGAKKKIHDYANLVTDKHISPDGKHKIVTKDVKIERVTGTDFYPELNHSNVQIYESLQYRHWDVWEDGAYSHVFIESIGEKTINSVDIMEGEPYDCPTMPFGGAEDYLWSPDGKKLLYVSKKLYGTAYTKSTNTDIYEYDLATKNTQNLTGYNNGYDMAPAFSSKGKLAWLQMKRDGYESDKNDIIVRFKNGGKEGDLNLTKDWDGTVNGFVWSNAGDKIYFNAPVGGTVHLFELAIPSSYEGKIAAPKQLTKGQFDVNGLVGHNGNTMVVYRRDMNHATELYTVDLSTGKMKQLTHENDAIYQTINQSKVVKRMVKTTDGKDMVTWVIYPPNFDETKKYPTLLYCQGGPQGALSQFYSFRWNFQLMAAQGYIVVAPNRRGMPGHGVEWNEQISGDYGGQNMKDYLAAIDDVAKEPYVDKDRLGCVGASYGGYSCFYLAGIHEKRFKSFIAHDGIFNWKSMYGTTEEMFFVNWDMGGNYWDKTNKIAQRSFNEFNPIEHVDKWDTPILVIQGGKDYRVPIGQGLEAFNAAQLRGIKSKLLYFPEENHWVLSVQNALIWQTEFFKWLEETLEVKK